MKELISKKKLLKELSKAYFMSFERNDDGERMITAASVENIVEDMKTEKANGVSAERLTELIKLEARVEAAVDYIANERYADIERVLRIIGTDKAIAAIGELPPTNIKL